MEFVRADSAAHATALLAEDPEAAKLIAGGTGLVLMMKHGLLEPERLVAIDGIDDLHGVSADDEAIRIGGCTRLAAASRDPLVAAELPGLRQALAVVGNVRIRNVATVGGNLVEADYASDPPPMLAALDASVRVEGTDGARHIPVDELITGYFATVLEPTEMVTAVEVPRRWGASVYEKFRTRSSEDRPCVGVAAAVQQSDGAVADLRVAIGAVGPRPRLLPEITNEVVGRPLDTEAIGHVAAGYAAQVETMNDHRGSSAYRTRIIGVLVARALRRLVAAHEEARR